MAKGKGKDWNTIRGIKGKPRPGDDADGLETPQGAWSPKGAAAWAGRTERMRKAANPGRSRKA